ncbi:hypothetical protein, partial [Porphyromonas gingivalis]|uniref:hypothetical protein n=1 Tax=Porphyromonas gingivalis TaxID=837 RepID=UPI00211BAB55
GLTVMAELPLVLVDVQRGGPSTGLPTKSEQTDLLQALFGRNGGIPISAIAFWRVTTTAWSPQPGHQRTY